MNEREKEQLRVKYEKWCYERNVASDVFDFNAELDSSLTFDEAWNEIEEKLSLLDANKQYENQQQIAIELNQSSQQEKDDWFKEAVKQSKVYVIVGKRGCLPAGTVIKTPLGKTKIENLNSDVLSYNLKKREIEVKKASLFKSGLKQILKIHTQRGIIKCSPEHKWIVVRDEKIQTIEAKELNTTDLLLLVK